MIRKSLVILLVLIVSFIKAQAQNSVLATGDWFKISVANDGVYCMTRSDLVDLGVNVGTTDPRKISLYGNKSGMLTMRANANTVDDLKEMAIMIKGESDGVFDAGDTLFFYGQSQDEKIADLPARQFYLRQNIYCDSTFYFLTVGSNNGKRIPQKANLASSTNSTTTYNEFVWHEYDSVNVLKSGKKWYGERFETQGTTMRIFSFPISRIAAASSLIIRTEAMGRSFSNATFDITNSGVTVVKNVAPVSGSTLDPYGSIVKDTLVIPPPVSDGNIQYVWQSPDQFSIAFIDKIELNFVSNLSFNNTQMIFTDLNSVSSGAITNYAISNVPNTFKLWEITDPLNVSEQQFNPSFPTIDFNATNDSVHTYIGLNGNAYLKPDLIGHVQNQNYHGIGNANYLIITSHDYANQTTQLANHHQTQNQLTTKVAFIDEIYNEYSTGAQDPTAVRNFIRQVFNASASANDSLKYVLFFGSGSYDYRGRLGSKSSFIPTYEFGENLRSMENGCSDEYFAYMSDTAGDYWNNRVEIGIGRLPVRNLTEAGVVNKIINYNTPNTLGSWRKRIAIIADDGANNHFFNTLDTIANRIESNSCDYNIRKIYLDAYERDTVGGVFSFPGVEADIKECIQSGSLVMHYSGFGGSLGWAHERILDTLFITSVVNLSNLPLFLGSTAEQNLFDNPSRNSIGRIMALSSGGGGIASMSSTRVSFASTDFNYSSAFHNHLFEKENNKYLRLGDIVKKAKQDFRDFYSLNYCLLGDPAIQLNYPENSVNTTAINGQPISGVPDTIVPGQLVHLDGEVTDQSGNVMTGFNGIIDIVVFDQKTLHYTLANDTLQNSIRPFYAWDDTASYINTQVVNGLFTASFYVPYEIDSAFGNGKISYYASNGITDASGCFQDIIFKNLTPGIIEISDVSVNTFPVPATDKILFAISASAREDYSVRITDLSGKAVIVIDNCGSKFYLHRGTLPPGIYFYELSGEKGNRIKTGKIIFQ